MAIHLTDLVAYLDGYLRVHEVPDNPRALNGLQVDAGRDAIDRLAVAVDACQATIDGAAAAGAGMLIVHHGLFWSGPEAITGRHGRRIRRCLEAGLAVYSAHIPLDLHPDVGNNAVLARDLGLTSPSPFGTWEGVAIGVGGTTDLGRDDFVRRVGQRLGVEPRLIPTGPDRVRKVAVVTGAASSLIKDARDAGYDTFLSGEGPHHSYFDAEEFGINVIYAGHYATETVGVQALARHLEERYQLPWTFIDHPTGL